MLDAIVAGLGPSLTDLDLSDCGVTDLSCLDRLFERPLGRPVKLHFHAYLGAAINIEGPAAPPLVLHLGLLFPSLDALESALPRLAARRYFSEMAARGELSFECRPRALVMDEFLLEAVAEQAVLFPDFVPVVRVPSRLIGQAAALVRAGRSFRLCVVAEDVDDEGVRVALEGLGRSLREAVGLVEVELLGAHDAAHLLGRLALSLLSSGPPLTQRFRLDLSDGRDTYLCWSSSKRVLKLFNLPVECLDRIPVGGAETVLVAFHWPKRQVEFGDDFLLSLLTVPGHVFIICPEKLSMLSVFSRWAGMIRAGAASLRPTVDVGGNLSVSLTLEKGSAAVRVRSGDLTAPLCLSDLVGILCYDFGVRALTLDVPAVAERDQLAAFARSISALPLESLAIEGSGRPDWVFDVIRPGVAGPLRHLIFDSFPFTEADEAYAHLVELLARNESLITIGCNRSLLKVSPTNYRLRTGTVHAARNMMLRSILASLLFALDLPDIIPSEIGRAIRRAQARVGQGQG